MKKKKVIFLKEGCNVENYEKFEAALIKYKPEILEKDPIIPTEIYQHYMQIDALYVWLRNAYKDSIYVLGNEVRAILGHLSEYNENDKKGRKNLEKANGHLRRLSIDILKVLCNAFDMKFDKWIGIHCKYEYRGVDKEYFPNYVSLYNKAHKEYIKVQKKENLGSDKDNEIIVAYHNVVTMYGELYKYHIDDRRIRIEKIKRKLTISRVLCLISITVITTLSVLGSIL